MYATKQEWTKLFKKIVDPLKPFYNPELADLHIGNTAAHYDEDAQRTEAFIRPLWGLVPFWAGGGQDPELARIYRTGIAAGTDPAGPGYWGDCIDYDQRFVEMAALAYGMLMSPDYVWNCLTDKEQDNLANWLYSINVHPFPDNNWNFFNILVNVALKKAGKPYSQACMDKSLAKIESFYIGGGWYADGHIDQRDYYISYAIHFYSLIYALYAEDEARAKIYRERAAEFAKTFIYWFSDTGAAAPYGRSMTYRFAQTAFWSACVLADVRPFPLGVMKGIITRHIEYWMNMPIYDNANVLTIGYGYPQLYMTEWYNAPGSPYWALKAFAFMALPDAHEFWSVPALPMPKLDDIALLEKPRMVAARNTNGSVTLFTPGVYSFELDEVYTEKYMKFAYSSMFGFSVSRYHRPIHKKAPDSMLAFELDGEYFVRQITLEYDVQKDKVYSKWEPLPGIMVETTIIPQKDGHIRRHKITSEFACKAYDCGFAVASGKKDKPELICREGYAAVKNTYSGCGVHSQTGQGKNIEKVTNCNLISPKTTIPAIVYTVPAGTIEIETIVEEY